MEMMWFIPTGGDGRYLGTTTGGRLTDAAYLQQIARAVDALGYAGALLPTGRACEDAWVVASSLIPVTQRMKFLVAVRPGLISPTVAARMASTFDRLSNGRLLINVVTGGDPVELAGEGLHLSHDARYEITDEFLSIWRALERGESVTFEGKHLQIADGKLEYTPLQQPYPALYFGGSSPAGLAVAARHADVYLTWGEPPAKVAEKVVAARRLAEAEGRTLRFGIRLHVIVRETEQEAWDAAADLIRYLDDATVEAARQELARFDSTGQRRMLELGEGHNGRSREALEVSPNLWSGVGLVRSGAGTALVGDPETVAARIRDYQEVGIETFILSGYPHLEEAYRVAELLFPRLTLDTPATPAPAESGARAAFGEAVGSYARPSA